MRRVSLFMCTIAVAALAAGEACAQSPNNMVGGSQFNPPPPPPPATPSVTVPKVPQMGVPSQPISQAAPRQSFHRRASRCLDESVTAGSTQADRDAYVRGCVNR
jgi:hypothetical protein